MTAAPPGRSRAPLAYLAMLGGTALAFLAIRWLGADLSAPDPPAEAARFGAAGETVRVEVLFHVLLALVVVIIAARALGALFRRLQQPPVVGEVLAGILLGPSLLGHVAPAASEFLLPPSVAPFLGVIAQVGILLYMFLVGLELDTGLLRNRTHASVAISHASIVAPFLLGSALAFALYPRLATSDVPFTSFAMFMGVAMSITAFPVLARILTDRRMQRTPLGTIALACAAVDDVTAWCLLALVVSIAQARPGSALVTASLTVAYLAGVLLLVRPAVLYLLRRHPQVTQGSVAVVLVGLLISALVTEVIGIHAIFGAFLLGAVIPHDSALARDLVHKLEDLVVILLLPAFFAFTGMRTQVGLVSGAEQWLLCGAIVLVACVGKFGGTFVAARVTGLGWREASSLGILMNTRGLMELVVLNIGLDLRVISPTLFAMMVLMALVTTFATTPILHALSLRPASEEAPLGEVRA